MELCDFLGQWIAGTEVPADGELDRITAGAIADCFGCILAGSDSDVAERVRQALVPLGPGQIPVPGTETRLPAPYAALAMSVAGHAWDLDDWEEPGNTHPTVVLLPTLLAAAHMRRASGRALNTAYVIGAEIILRLGEAVGLGHYARGFHSTATLGTIGAAAAASRFLGLTGDQASHALALATSQAVGYTVQFGSNAKPLQAGFAARAGLEAALLAQSEATGQPSVLDGPRGFAGLMGEHSSERLARLKTRLGDPFALAEYGLILKPWPSCGYTHRLMTAALELRPLIGGRPDRITAIHTEMPDFHKAILPFDRPVSRNEALFSAPACVAQSIVAGTLTLADSAARFWLRPDVARLVGLCTIASVPARNPRLNNDPDQPDLLSVTMADGEVLQASCAYPLGAPQNPMSNDHLAEKYRDITGRSRRDFQRLLGWRDATDAAQFFMEASR